MNKGGRVILTMLAIFLLCGLVNPLFSDDEIPVLLPGSGWVDETWQPDVAGFPGDPGYDAKVIARWDVVPYQRFEGLFEIGVIAFHMNGIDYVKFSVNDGPWVAVNEMKINPRTGVNEYFVRLDANDFADGLVEVRAIAYPKTAGVPRLLAGNLTDSANDTIRLSGEHSMFLYANANRTLPAPVRYVSCQAQPGGDGTQDSPLPGIREAVESILASTTLGGTVLLKDPGRYHFKTLTYPYSSGTLRPKKGWITIRPVDTLERSQVVIDDPDTTARITIRPKADFVKWENVTFDFNQVSQYYPEYYDHIWFENCHFTDPVHGWTPPNGILPLVRYADHQRIFFINCLAEDLLYGLNGAYLTRNCEVKKISGDALQNSRMVVNTNVVNIDGSILGHHTDLLQYWGPKDNVIIYGVRARELKDTQSIFLYPVHRSMEEPRSVMENCAFVNCDFNGTDPDGNGGPPWSQMTTKFDHMLYINLKIPHQRMVLRTDLTSGYNRWEAKNVVFRNCMLHPATYDGYVVGAAPEGSTFEGCYRAGDVPVDPTEVYAHILATPSEGYAPLTVQFDGTNSGGPQGTTVVSWEWNFGDGQTGSGVTVEHVLQSSGTYRVKLTVTDQDGQTAETFKTIVVHQRPVNGLVFGLTFDGHVSDGSIYRVATQWKNGEAYGPGVSDRSGYFNGLPVSAGGNYVSCAKDQNMFGLEQVSMMLWFKKEDPDLGSRVFWNHTRYGLTVGKNSVTFHLWTDTGSVATTVTVPGIADTEWHHLAMTWDGGIVRGYVDGNVVMTRELGGRVGNVSSWSPVIGANPWGASFKGWLDELQVFNRSLSQNEIAAAFNANRNQAPVVDAGADRTFENKTGMVGFRLSGNVTDDGLPNPPGRVSLLWEKMAGEGRFLMYDTTKLESLIVIYAPGTYVFRLTANDGEKESFDEVTVVVKKTAEPVFGDINDDGVVNFADLNILLANYGRIGDDLPGDLNFDGKVDFSDLNIMLELIGG